jgi:hypothetical protein
MSWRLFHYSLVQIIYNDTLTEILDGTNNRRYQNLANSLPVLSRNTQSLAEYPRNLLTVGPEGWQSWTSINTFLLRPTSGPIWFSERIRGQEIWRTARWRSESIQVGCLIRTPVFVAPSTNPTSTSTCHGEDKHHKFLKKCLSTPIKTI